MPRLHVSIGVQLVGTAMVAGEGSMQGCRGGVKIRPQQEAMAKRVDRDVPVLACL